MNNPISIRLNEEMLEELGKIAEIEQSSRNRILRIAIRNFLDKQKNGK